MTELPGYVVASKGGSLVSVFVQPRAARNEIVGLQGPALKMKVKAAPEQGKANRAACELLAAVVGIPARDLKVISGAASRHKRIALNTPPARVVTAVERVLSSRALGGHSQGGRKEGT